MKNRKATGYVSPSDLVDLQVTFDTILAKHSIERGSPRSETVATSLLMAHSAGVTGHDELIRYVEEASGLRLAD